LKTKEEDLDTNSYEADVSGNPFISSIDKYLSTENLLKRLETSPLTGVNVASLGMQQRFDLLDRIHEEYFVPMSTSVDITTRLYRLIHKGYLNRDPTNPIAKKKTMKLAQHNGNDLKDLPWHSNYAKGMAIIGITGLGKTHEIKRALQLLPQCVEHEHSKAAGWASMKQVVWLYVAMSHDGTLGGLLQQIICALDEAMGTEYSQDRSFTRLSNEKLAVALGIKFRVHGVGVLVIDEIQYRNFSGDSHGGLAATFFLRLLNFGIPVVLVGNPLGFKALYSFAQDVRRIGSGGTINLHPVEEDDFDWNTCLIPSLCRQNLMPDTSPVTNYGELLYRFSGGIRDYACRIHVVAQKLALDLGHRFVTKEHIMEAFWGADFSDDDRSLIAGFRDKNPVLLSKYNDIPWENYAVKWKLFKDNSTGNQSQNMPPEQTEKSQSGSTSIPNLKSVSQKDLENIKRQRTRKANSSEKQSVSRNSVGSSDMRGDGLKEFLIKGIASFIAEPGRNK
jgi:hypothetical protein